jgi:hypothetical protein
MSTKKLNKKGQNQSKAKTTTTKPRTVKQLLRILNPGRKKRSKWQYIGVTHDQYGDPELSDVEIHELHFNERGGFVGITENPVTISASSQADLVKWLLRVRRDIKNSPVLTPKEFNLIYWGRQYGAKRNNKK